MPFRISRIERLKCRAGRAQRVGSVLHSRRTASDRDGESNSREKALKCARFNDDGPSDEAVYSVSRTVPPFSRQIASTRKTSGRIGAFSSRARRSFAIRAWRSFARIEQRRAQVLSRTHLLSICADRRWTIISSFAESFGAIYRSNEISRFITGVVWIC